MPSIASRLREHPTNPIVPAQPSPLPRPSLPSGVWGAQPSPIVSPTLRCPLPPGYSTAVPDNLRQYYAGGQIPQYRLNPPGAINSNQTSSLATSKTPGTIVPDGVTLQVKNGVLSVIS